MALAGGELRALRPYQTIKPHIPRLSLASSFCSRLKRPKKALFLHHPRIRRTGRWVARIPTYHAAPRAVTEDTTPAEKRAAARAGRALWWIAQLLTATEHLRSYGLRVL